MSIKIKSSGFTVVEVVITIVVAGFILLGMTTMITTLNLVNDRAQDLTLANALAEQKVEHLRSVGFNALSNGTFSFDNELPATIATPRSAQYVISDAIDPATSTAMPNVKQVDITITYNNHGNTKNLKYTTYIGELGVGQY